MLAERGLAKLRRRQEDDTARGAVSAAYAKIAAIAKEREQLAAAILGASSAVTAARVGLGARSGGLDDLEKLTAGLLGAADDAHNAERMTTAADMLGDGWPADLAVAAVVFLFPLDSRHKPGSVAVEDLARANPSRFVRELPNAPTDEKTLRAWLQGLLKETARLALDNKDGIYWDRFQRARRFMASFDPLAPLFLD